MIVAAAIIAWLPVGGLSYFWQRTIGFQMHRFDVFRPGRFTPDFGPCKTALGILAVAARRGWVAFFPRERSLYRVCALAGAVTVAVQLPATHWFFYYIMWFLPFVLVAFLPTRRSSAVPRRETQRAERMR